LEAQERGTPQWLANAKAEIEQTRQKADALSRQVAGQSAANDKLQAELDNLRVGHRRFPIGGADGSNL